MHDDIEAIRRLKARYFRLMDEKDWAGLRGLFADDIHFDVRGGLGPSKKDDTYDEPAIEGADEAVAFLRNALDAVVSIHQGFMPEISIGEEGRASGVWAMADIIRAPEGAPFRELRGYGHYHEEYVRAADGWKIARLRLTRLAVDITT
ncbi:bile-acid 7-alpha-dehydratase [Novosphingobium marinum]|uniref:SnoaL-like domain-containing protein n=1 Tax=Novosphingobium marinum TaxID=1514948 RepID=A0A7Y9XVB0_9SPHN|nr:nuclear transport factor 2 family protein [Novosphingobium marinum]NYH94035.1 hypothetical protein [Novosphingobium marinum]GGC19116.1 bile-acid 7-alpha-dehydratase [Novosphingobium marinum]